MVKIDLRIRLVGEQADLLEIVVEAALAEHQSVAVESVGFARISEGRRMKDFGEVVVRSDPKGERCDRPLVLVWHRSGDNHHGQVRAELAFFVLQQQLAAEGLGDKRFAGVCLVEEFLAEARHPLADNRILVGRQHDAIGRDEHESGVAAKLDLRSQAITNCVQGLGRQELSFRVGALARRQKFGYQGSKLAVFGDELDVDLLLAHPSKHAR